MRGLTSAVRYRAGIATLAVALTGTGMAGVGVVAAHAGPSHPAAVPAAAPAVACPIPLPLPGVCDTTSPSPSASTSATTSPTASSTSTSGSSCPLPIPLPGLCDSTSPSASATASSTASHSATPTASATASHTPTPTPTPTHSTTPTTSPSPTATADAHPPTVGFRHETATEKHPTQVVITLFARGSRIAKLIDVSLRHCAWNLGKPTTKHFKGGKNKLRIVVTRNHEGTKGHVRFTVVNAAGQKRLVKTHV